ncbi:MAG TPA: efflux RND transporter periplasmic adaptor subunit [Ramlibacter sp.]|uniref:efflux RND transporter periplasmic adaptor subunit n=1 Tax=Ramlibacter sp. TaxID=1917967 RepID=UPI002BE062B2|nr:efflux RND transporter periplasmic adaptor subunit [Ramlibacter sp.]HVZ43518.1 efflux RND transporter periplasmic adaptor subunit [Ramlibacter sp.]
MFIRKTSAAIAAMLAFAAALSAPARADDPAQLKPSRTLDIQRLGASAARPRPLPAAAAAAAAASPLGGSPADQVRVLLVAELETTLSSPGTGRITHLAAATGAPFRAGQTLVGFDCDEPTARLKMAQAELAGAQETLEARVRMQGLEQASDVEVALAAAAVNKARGQVDLTKAQIAQCSIRAPWAGRVAKVHVKNFMSVTPGQPLLDLVKSGPLRLKLNLPSKMVSRVADGKVLDVVIDETGKTYEARVRAVNSRVDPVSQTVEIEAAMVHPYPELLPGMSGVAHLNTLH